MTSRQEKTSSFRLKNNLLALFASLLLALAPAALAQTESTQLPESFEPFKNMGMLQADIRPVNPQTDDTGKFYYEIKPGDTISDQLWLVNTSPNTNDIRIYPSHTIPGENGQTGFSIPEDDEPKEISAWVTLESEQFKLEPGEQKQVSYIITVPADIPYGLYKGGFAISKFVPAPEGGMLNTSFRKIRALEINVTAAPAEFKQNIPGVFRPDITFWIALGAFTASAVYYFVSKQRDKNKKHAK